MSALRTLEPPSGAINFNIVNYLKENKNGFPSYNGDVLFHAANISAHICKLRDMGYCIQSIAAKDVAGPFVWYRLVKPSRYQRSIKRSRFRR